MSNYLVSWHNKKQNSISLSTAEAKYIVAGSGCPQLLWMKQIMKDYGLEKSVMELLVENKSAIQILKNPVQRSCTKHIDIRHHFNRDLVEGVIALEFVETKNQLTDIFTKPLDLKRFMHLRSAIGMCEI